MNIMLNELKRRFPLHGHAALDRLVIESLDCALYQAFVEFEGSKYLVWENEKQMLRSHNLNEIRSWFFGLKINSRVLQQRSAFDEMIGQPIRDSNLLEVPIAESPFPEPEKGRVVH